MYQNSELVIYCLYFSNFHNNRALVINKIRFVVEAEQNLFWKIILVIKHFDTKILKFENKQKLQLMKIPSKSSEFDFFDETAEIANRAHSWHNTSL